MANLDRTKYETWKMSDWKDYIDELIRNETIVDSIFYKMTGQYSEEKKITSEYSGRELYEMLQNAHDAGIKAEFRNKVLIELTDNTLIIANTGKFFPPWGIESLCTPGYSEKKPERKSERSLIGYMGRGFRSILNWASNIAIVSNKLSIGFSREHSEKVGRALYENQPENWQRLEAHIEGADKFPIATLAIPIWLDVNNCSDPIFAALIQQIDTYKKHFDTVIGFTFKDALKTRSSIESEIKNLTKEVMLFINNIKELEIKSQSRKVLWTSEGNKEELCITEDGIPSKWRLKRCQGELPPQLQSDPRNKLEYDIKIAVPEDGKAHDRLFSHFPTEVNFPFPIFAHATFELDPSRKHLASKSPQNEYICEKLAKAMTEVAEESIDASSPWKALSIIMPQGPVGQDLEALGFPKYLLEYAAKKNIFPVRDGQFYDAQKAVSLCEFNQDINDVLKDKPFHDLCLGPSDPIIKGYLIMAKAIGLGFKSIGNDDLINRMNRISATSLSLSKRARLIHSYISVIRNFSVSLDNNEKAFPYSGSYTPKLLVNENNQLIATNNSVYLDFDFSEYLHSSKKAQFLSPDLAKELITLFNITDDLLLASHKLAQQLECFGVQIAGTSPDFWKLIYESALSASEEKQGFGPLRAIQLLHSYYPAFIKFNIFTKPDDLRISMPTRTDTFAESNTLYFGKEYKNGYLNEYLLGSIAPEQFIAPPDQLGFEEIPVDLESFLEWTGVSKYPKDSTMSERTGAYKDYVVSHLEYPAIFSGLAYDKNVVIRSLQINTTRFEHFDEIIKIADPQAIIAWMIDDRRFADPLETKLDNKADVKMLPTPRSNYKLLERQSPPSYIIWYISNTNWLRDANGNNCKPVECVLNPGELSNCFPKLRTDYDHQIFRDLDIDRKKIDAVLSKIGVKRTIRNLDPDNFYQIIKELPNKDPEGLYARSVYTSIIGLKETLSNIRDKFPLGNKLFGKYNNRTDYYACHELIYLDKNILPVNLRKYFKLLDVDLGQGTGVERWLNVKTIDSIEINKIIKVGSHITHPSAEIFNRDMERLKAYVYASKLDGDPSGEILDKLKKLRIELVKSLDIQAVDNGEMVKIDLMNGEYIEIEAKYFLFTSAGILRSVLDDPNIAWSVCEIISNLFDISADEVNSLILYGHTPIINKIIGSNASQNIKKAQDLLRKPNSLVLGDIEPTDFPHLPAPENEKPSVVQAKLAQPAPSSGDSPGNVTSTATDLVTPKTASSIERKGNVLEAHIRTRKPAIREKGVRAPISSSGEPTNFVSITPPPVIKRSLSKEEKDKIGHEGERYIILNRLRKLVESLVNGKTIDTRFNDEEFQFFKNFMKGNLSKIEDTFDTKDISKPNGFRVLSLQEEVQYEFVWKNVGQLQPGHDIEVVNISNDKRVFIEVKSTSGDDREFEMTGPQFREAASNITNYIMYTVYNALSEPEIEAIFIQNPYEQLTKGDLLESIDRIGFSP